MTKAKKFNGMKRGCHTLKKSLTVYKKLAEGKVARLRVPKGAQLVIPDNADNQEKQKIRVSQAFVVDIYTPSQKVPNGHDRRGRPVFKRVARVKHKEACNKGWGQATIMTYFVGREIFPDWLDRDVDETCGHGINAFLKRSQAERYDGR